MKILAVQAIAPVRLPASRIEPAINIDRSDSFRSAAKQKIKEVAINTRSTIVKVILGEVEFSEQILIDFDSVLENEIDFDQMIDNAIIIIERYC